MVLAMRNNLVKDASAEVSGSPRPGLGGNCVVIWLISSVDIGSRGHITNGIVHTASRPETHDGNRVRVEAIQSWRRANLNNLRAYVCALLRNCVGHRL